MTFIGFKLIVSAALKAGRSRTAERLFRVSVVYTTCMIVAHSSALSAADAAIVPPSIGTKLFSSVLEHQEDRYDGVIVDAIGLPDNRDDFSSHLSHSLHNWKASGKRGVWLKIPHEKLEFAATAIDLGFVMHHAEKDYLMLTHWLSEDENKLPPNASHQIGVGCIVVNDEGKLLLVQEKNGPLKGMGIWKLPTGLLDAKEDIHLAACREVLEETGIETEFVGLVGFRHAHNFQFGKSDMFFVCLLKPLTKNIVKQESEIADCDWIDLEVYMAQKLFKSSPVYSKLNDCIESIVKQKDPKSYLQRLILPLGMRPGHNTLYLPSESIEEVIDSAK